MILNLNCYGIFEIFKKFIKINIELIKYEVKLPIASFTSLYFLSYYMILINWGAAALFILFLTYSIKSSISISGGKYTYLR